MTVLPVGSTEKILAPTGGVSLQGRSILGPLSKTGESQPGVLQLAVVAVAVALPRVRWMTEWTSGAVGGAPGLLDVVGMLPPVQVAIGVASKATRGPVPTGEVPLLPGVTAAAAAGPMSMATAAGETRRDLTVEEAGEGPPPLLAARGHATMAMTYPSGPWMMMTTGPEELGEPLTRLESSGHPRLSRHHQQRRPRQVQLLLRSRGRQTESRTEMRWQVTVASYEADMIHTKRNNTLRTRKWM